METIKTMKAAYRAAVEPSSYNEEKNTFDVTFTTSAPVQRYDWERDRYYDEVLSFDPGHVKLERLNNSAPVLDNHNRFDGVTRSVIGVVERAWIENGQGAATIRFSNREEVKGIVQDVKDGILKNVSIGYSVKKLKIEDNEDKRPVYRAVDWEPFEISLVPVPADAKAQVRSLQENFETIEVINEINETPVEITESNSNHTAAKNARLLIFEHKHKVANEH